MAFDKSKDENLGEKIAVEDEQRNLRLTVGIHRYDKGEPKVQITRQHHWRNTDTWQVTTLGWLTFEELNDRARLCNS